MMRDSGHKKAFALWLLAGGVVYCIGQTVPHSQDQAEHQANEPFIVYAVLAIIALIVSFVAVRLYLRNRQLEKEYALAIKTKESFYAQNLALGAISHDLRTPLTLILGNIELIRAELERFKGDFSNPAIAHLPDFFSNKINIVRQNAEGLSNYVAKLLNANDPNYESLEQDGATLQSDVLAFIRYGMSIVDTMVDKQHVELNVETPLDKLVMDFNMDELGNLLLNVFTNALKFTPKGGKITIGIDADGPGRILGQPLPPGFEPSHAVFTVTDTGIGIPKKNLSKIFERGFYTKPINELSMAEGDKGSSGIGLFSVKSQVEKLNGEISVKSEEGRGTSFTIRIPITHQAPLRDWILGEVENSVQNDQVPNPTTFLEDASSSTSKVLTNDTNLPTLLIIEDNEGIVDYVKSSFQGIFEVDFAYNGLVGIEKAIENAPDIIITDLMMPGKNGYEVCEALKKDERTSHIPIVMLTALTDIKSRVSGLSKGADAYIGKPAYREELHATLNSLLETRKKLQAKYLTFATQATHKNNEATVKEEPLPENEFLGKLRIIIEENIADAALDVEAICRKIGMSRSSLHAKLTALTGTSITHFVRVIRLNHAKELLSNSSMNVSEIAASVGFDNPNYFSRLFSEEFGVPPSTYRKGI